MIYGTNYYSEYKYTGSLPYKECTRFQFEIQKDTQNIQKIFRTTKLVNEVYNTTGKRIEVLNNYLTQWNQNEDLDRLSTFGDSYEEGDDERSDLFKKLNLEEMFNSFNTIGGELRTVQNKLSTINWSLKTVDNKLVEKKNDIAFLFDNDKGVIDFDLFIEDITKHVKIAEQKIIGRRKSVNSLFQNTIRLEGTITDKLTELKKN